MNLHHLLLGVIVFVAVLCAAAAWSLSSDTLISGPLVACAALTLALATARPALGMWSRLTGTDRGWINTAVHTLTLAAVLSGIFFTGNYFGADMTTRHTEKVVIERKFTQTRYRTRRINRRTTGRGAPYKVYYVDLTMPDGSLKTLQMPKDNYLKLRSGDEAEVTLAKGLFGVTVIRRDVPVRDLGHAPM